jgi:hypothetical protein
LIEQLKSQMGLPPKVSLFPDKPKEKPKEKTVEQMLRPQPTNLLGVMQRLEKDFKMTAEQRQQVRNFLYTRQTKKGIGPQMTGLEGRITGLEGLKPWEELEQFYVPDPDYHQAKAALTRGDLSGLTAQHAAFVKARENGRQRLEQEKQAKAIESLPFTMDAFDMAVGSMGSVPTKDGRAMDLGDATRLLARLGIPQRGITPAQHESAQEAQAASGKLTPRQLIEGQTEAEAIKDSEKLRVDPPESLLKSIQESKQEKGLKMDPLVEGILNFIGDPVIQAGTMLDPDKTPGERMAAAAWLAAEVFGAGIVAKGGQGLKKLLSTEKAWSDFASKAKSLGIPDHIKVTEQARSYLDDPQYFTYLEAAAKVGARKAASAGKGGLDEAAEFASKQAGTPPDVPPVGKAEAIERFKAAMRDSEKVGRPEREAAVDALREAQAARLGQVTAKGRASVPAGRAARKVGQTDNPDFVFKDAIPDADQDALFDVINDYDWGKRVQSRQDALEALDGIFQNGKLPQPNEIKLLEEVFGADFTRAITGHQRPIADFANAFGREMQLMNPWSRAFDVVSNTTKFAAYVALNPLRSVLSSMTFGKTVGRETLITPTKIMNVVKGYRKTLSTDVGEVMAGINKATGHKFEGRTGFFTKAAGLTDAPFYPLYERLAMDDFALTASKNLPGGVKANRQAAFKQLTEGAPGPLTKAQVNEAHAIANEWALRQTYNIDNAASMGLRWLKQNGSAKIEQQFPGRAGREAAAFLRLGVDVNTRFSRVIGNVALDALNYVPQAGLTEAGLRLVLGRLGGKIPAKDARLIADLASKGLTGTATTAVGVALYPTLKDADWIRGEIVTTKGGTRFVRWTLLPDAFGGMDADQLPGAFKAILRGATRAMLDERDENGNRVTGLTDKQTEEVWNKYQVDQYVSQPALSGSMGALKVALGDATFGKYAGSRAASQTLPGGLREFAERRDEAGTGVLLRKANDAPEGEDRHAKFWREFFSEYHKRIPGLREQLAPNIKGAGGLSLTDEERKAAVEAYRKGR